MNLPPSWILVIPSNLDDGIMYICLNCNVIVHKCACGCGEKTVTPIDRNYGWIMKYDGQTVTLRPSIGNFSIPCNSHYYITENRVEWIEKYQNQKRRKKIFEVIKKLITK